MHILSNKIALIILTTIIINPYCNGDQIISYYFKPNDITTGGVTGRKDFANDEFNVWYEDNTPTGNAVFDYIAAEGLVFNNGQIEATESNTSLYFNRNNLGKNSEFEFIVLTEIPKQFQNFTPNQVLSVDLGLFYGPKTNQYEQQLTLSFGVANVENLIQGRASLFFSDDEEIFELKEVTDEATLCLSKIRYLPSSNQINFEQQFFKSNNEVAELVATTDYVYTVDNSLIELEFVPYAGFNSENIRVPLLEKSFIADNMPKILSITLISDNSTTNPPTDDRLTDSDNDGIPDLIETTIGTNPNEISDVDEFFELLSNSTIIRNNELTYLRNNGLLIKRDLGQQSINLEINIEASSDLENWESFSGVIYQLPEALSGKRWFRFVD